MDKNSNWNIRFKEGDVVHIPHLTDKWCFYIDKRYIYSLVDHRREDYNPMSDIARTNCSGDQYELLLNIFDFKDSKNIQSILCGNDMNSIKFIMDYLKNELKEKQKV